MVNEFESGPIYAICYAGRGNFRRNSIARTNFSHFNYIYIQPEWLIVPIMK